MAAGTQADLILYNDEFWGGFVEATTQNVDAFNAKSGGAIVLSSGNHRGQYQKESFIAKTANLVTRRDPTSIAAATILKLAMGEIIRPKLSRKIGPIQGTEDEWRMVRDDGGYSNEELSYIMGQQYGVDVAADQLNTALGALRGALLNVAANRLILEATDVKLTYAGSSGSLVSAQALFGDRAPRLTTIVMHSKVWNDLIIDGLTNYKIDTVAGATIVTGAGFALGKTIIVTDSPALIDATGGSGNNVNAYATLLLQPGAAGVILSQQRGMLWDRIPGLENILYSFQAEYAYTLGIKGFKWDIANGGANPDATAAALGTNWDQTVANVKDTAGVVITTI